LWVIFAFLDPGSGYATLPGGSGFTDLQATDGVVHGVGLAGDVLLTVDEAGQAAQVRQVDPRCENLSVSAGHHTGKRESKGLLNVPLTFFLNFIQQ
jgi:hypothetical protein